MAEFMWISLPNRVLGIPQLLLLHIGLEGLEGLEEKLVQIETQAQILIRNKLTVLII